MFLKKTRYLFIRHLTLFALFFGSSYMPLMNGFSILDELHEGLLLDWTSTSIYNLYILGYFLKLIENYVADCKQRIVLNSQTLSWEKVLSGVPQGSVPRPPLFVMYIKNLQDGIQSICKIFEDDTSLFSKCPDFKNLTRIKSHNWTSLLSKSGPSNGKRTLNLISPQKSYWGLLLLPNCK